MSLALNVSTELTTVDCGQCGGVYAINARYRHQKEKEGGFWTCPYCNVSWGFVTSENQRLQRALDNERKRREWAQQEAREAESRRRAAAGQLTKFKNRVGKGVCPCCNRTFQNLQRHMKSQHPDLVAKE